MENSDLREQIRNLREWAPLAEVLNKIPQKVQKGLFFQDLNVTCVDILPEFVALGTDAGIVYWYNRNNGEVQKLRCELASTITCIRVISSVEYMIAVGNIAGQVSAFQIQKELPPELSIYPSITNVVHKQPIERYTIKDLNRSAITCVEWSKNGMKLFSGDKQGVVILTEFDYAEHISKSVKILNEAYGIVQIGFCSPWLLVSTVYRAIICRKNDATGDWNVSQIGKKDRKILNNFGAVFTGSDRRSPSIVCSRPGFRFWLADTDGNVSHTFLLKDAVAEPTFEIPLLNPGLTKLTDGKFAHFGPCYNYNGSFIITHCDTIIYIINLEKLKIEATIKRLRKIQYLTCYGPEIFILEGGHSMIRIAPFPEPSQAACGKDNQFSSSKIASSASSSVSSSSGADSAIFEPPIEYEPEEDSVGDADECFELPPIEYIHLDTPLFLNEHQLLKHDRLLLEHSRKLEVFEKINQLDYDDSILYKTAMKKKKKFPDTKSNEKHVDGIVEIGQQALTEKEQCKSKAFESPKTSIKSGQHNSHNKPSSSQDNGTTENCKNDCDIEKIPESNCNPNLSLTTSSQLKRNLIPTQRIPIPDSETTTRPCLLDASFCESVNLVPNLRSPSTSRKELKEKEDHLAAVLNIEPVILEQIKINPETRKLPEPPPPLINFTYPLNYPINDYDDSKTVLRLKNASTLNQVHNGKNNAVASTSSSTTSSLNPMYKSQINNFNESLSMRRDNMSKSLNLTFDDVPAIRKIPDYMHIPNLWDIKIEEDTEHNAPTVSNEQKREEKRESCSSSCSEWEFV